MSALIKFPAYVNGQATKQYNQHRCMLQRCSTKNNSRVDYVGNSVTPEWLRYKNWVEWACDQKGFSNFESNGRLWSLDKDILLKGNKHYCPELCVFVPNQINQFFKLQESSRGNYLLGASPQNNGVDFKCRINNGEGKHIYLGQFPSQEEAHEAYLEGKTNLGKELVAKYENIVDERVLIVLSNFKKWYLG